MRLAHGLANRLSTFTMIFATAQQAWDQIFRDHDDRQREKRHLTDIRSYQVALEERDTLNVRLRRFDITKTALIAALNKELRFYDPANPVLVDDATIAGIAEAGMRAWTSGGDHDTVREAGRSYPVPDVARGYDNPRYDELRKRWVKADKLVGELFVDNDKRARRVQELEEQVKALSTQVQALESGSEDLQAQAGEAGAECKRLEEAATQHYAVRAALASALAKADPGHPLIDNSELRGRIASAGVQAFRLAPAGQRWQAVREAGESFAVRDDRGGAPAAQE